ncbi:hypothetical protein SeMB42_g05745 [Synchytrium endobioticum]|uniref:Uncharacterized protein n=1 Tax=Synchytrium endobioticum TaxID=286115 RepID=A0A507CPJ9_9FUNG|nr:hypothetical protein SeMB42_g05742 [Synchytrium endobioticum]TPX41072.1 hypothetical protein SeMB42_g05745 [Synchytrium endobioticum]
MQTAAFKQKKIPLGGSGENVRLGGLTQRLGVVQYFEGYLKHDERPPYLKPPSKDKNTPMKRKADEGGTSLAGPSKSRKTR